MSAVACRVPVDVLMGTLFELLRSGGSYSLVRRIWAQYRLTLNDTNPLREVSWSKTEVMVSVSFVVLCVVGECCWGGCVCVVVMCIEDMFVFRLYCAVCCILECCAVS